jgi:hypothetical protein
MKAGCFSHVFQASLLNTAYPSQEFQSNMAWNFFKLLFGLLRQNNRSDHFNDIHPTGVKSQHKEFECSSNVSK